MDVKNPLLKNVSLFRRTKKATAVAVLLLVAVGTSAQTDRQLVRHGNKQFRKGNNADAEVSYRKAVEKNQRNPQANYNLGNALMMQRKDSLAITQYEKAAKLETNPLRRAQAYHNMGVVCQQHQMFGEAIEAYKEALRNNPTDDHTRYNLELCKRQQKQQDQNQQDKDNKDNKEQNKDKQDQQKQDQQKQDQKKDEQKQNQQQQQMSKENAEQLLNAAMQEEKQTQDRMKKAKQQPQRRRLEKNW